MTDFNYPQSSDHTLELWSGSDPHVSECQSCAWSVVSSCYLTHSSDFQNCSSFVILTRTAHLRSSCYDLWVGRFTWSATTFSGSSFSIMCSCLKSPARFCRTCSLFTFLLGWSFSAGTTPLSKKTLTPPPWLQHCIPSWNNPLWAP